MISLIKNKIFSKNNASPFFYIGISVIVLFFFAAKYITHDLFWDEIMSLHFFAFKNFGETISSEGYRPNNHIFFNLFNNAIRQILGIENLYESFNHIWLLRLCQIPFALMTLYFSYQFGKRFFNQNTAIITIILLVTTLPFLNFITQLRGYNFTMLFVIACLYYSFLYLEERKPIHLVLSAVVLYLLLYTIPSNAYFAIPFCLLWLIKWLYTHMQKNSSLNLSITASKSKQKNALLYLLISYALVAILIYWTYQPFLDRIITDKFISRTAHTRFYVLSDLLPRVLDHFTSTRSLLIIIAIIGLYPFFTKATQKLKNTWWALFFLLIMAFIIPFLRNDLPQERYLLFILPVYVLLIAVLINYGLDLIKNKLPFLQKKSNILVYIYCISVLFFQYNRIQNELKNNVRNSTRVISLDSNFYQSENYQPHNLAKFINQNKLDKSHPLLMMPHELDMIAAAQYLKNTGLDIYLPKNIQAGNKQMVILHINPNTKQHLKKHLKHSFKQSLQHKGIWLLGLLDFIENNHPSDKYYIVSSYETRLYRLYNEHCKTDYHLKKISQQENDFNLYLLSKKEYKNTTTHKQ